MAAPEHLVNDVQWLSLPESGHYDDFKLAVHETIPTHPQWAQKMVEHDIVDLGAVEFHWRDEPKRHKSDDGHDYWFLLGEAEYHGHDWNEFQQGLFAIGRKYRGWTPGVNPSFMGHCWVFNLTVAVRAL